MIVPQGSPFYDTTITSSIYFMKYAKHHDEEVVMILEHHNDFVEMSQRYPVLTGIIRKCENLIFLFQRTLKTV